MKNLSVLISRSWDLEIRGPTKPKTKKQTKTPIQLWKQWSFLNYTNISCKSSPVLLTVSRGKLDVFPPPLLPFPLPIIPLLL